MYFWGQFLAFWSGMICLFGSNALAAEGKQIVTVNIQDVLLGSASGQVVKNVLEEKVVEFQTKFQTEQEEVDAMRAVWSQQVKEEKERDFQKRVRELQLKSEDAQFELQQLEKQVMEPILNELQKVIAEMGEKNGYALILDSRAGILYADKSMDISELVKKELDSRQEAKKQDK
jgi:outer membrane protein